jgi:hypothetical protein
VKKSRPPEGFASAFEIHGMYPEYSAYQIARILGREKHPKIARANEPVYYLLDGVEQLLRKHSGVCADENYIPPSKTFSFGNLELFRQIAKEHRDYQNSFWG